MPRIRIKVIHLMVAVLPVALILAIVARVGRVQRVIEAQCALGSSH
jgi:hypothetical protein